MAKQQAAHFIPVIPMDVESEEKSSPESASSRSPLHAASEGTHTESSNSKQPFQPTGWQGKEKSTPPAWDQSLWMEDMMAALSEQLQRDFKRYYGA